MKNRITGFLTAIICVACFLTGHNAMASTTDTLYKNNFDDTSKVRFPSDWVNNYTDSNWTTSNSKASQDTLHNSSKDLAMFFDANIGHPAAAKKMKDVMVTFSGVSTLKYQNITLNWSETFSGAFISNGDSMKVEYSADGGKTWDMVVHTYDTAGTKFAMWTNGGVPIVLPANASNVAKLMVRWVGYSTAVSGNYQFDNFSITGTKIVTGIEEENAAASDIKSWFANDALNIRFDDNTSKQAEISIYNLNGTQVYHSNGRTEGDMFIQLNNLTPGMYITRIVTNQDTYTSRFVK